MKLRYLNINDISPIDEFPRINEVTAVVPGEFNWALVRHKVNARGIVECTPTIVEDDCLLYDALVGRHYQINGLQHLSRRR